MNINSKNQMYFVNKARGRGSYGMHATRSRIIKTEVISSSAHQALRGSPPLSFGIESHEMPGQFGCMKRGP